MDARKGQRVRQADLQSRDPLAREQRPDSADLVRLTPAARRQFENHYATMEITDSVALIGAHQVALVRDYFGKLQDATQRL